MMSDVLEATKPGWRPDPSGRYEWRYWDNGWTNRVANSTRPGPEGAAGPESRPSAEPVAAPAQAAATAPASPPKPAAAPEPVATRGAYEDPVPAPEPPPGFRTFPLPHDGKSGTIWDEPYVPESASPAGADAAPRAAGGWLRRWVRGFWEQPESYHSAKAGVALPPHPKESGIAQPTYYGRAGLVMLAACGVAIGAYLPFISGRVDTIPFDRTGLEMGQAWGFTWAAAAFAIAAILGARHRVMGWVTMGISAFIAALVARQLVLVHEQVMSLNTGPAAHARVGTGLWIMLGSAAVGLIAAFRLETSQEIS